MWLRVGEVKRVVKLRQQHKHHPVTSAVTRAVEVFYWKSLSDTNVDFSWPSSLWERGYRARGRFILHVRLLRRRAPVSLSSSKCKAVQRNNRIKESSENSLYVFFSLFFALIFSPPTAADRSSRDHPAKQRVQQKAVCAAAALALTCAAVWSLEEFVI